jgi:hypothetical protein
MAFRKHRVITLKRLNSALDDVRTELDRFGLWNARLADIDVYLTWFGDAYGYQFYRTTSQIEIPAVSLSRLWELLACGTPASLRDILRHEYGHAVADTNRGLMRSRQFREAFGTHHDNHSPSEYSPERHVSGYAATDAGEDFAEVFMHYLKHSGKLPSRLTTPPIRTKWNFVRRLACRIQDEKRSWAA